MESCSKNIKDLRVKNNLTQAELGEKLNVTSQAVSKWENNLSEPDLESIKKMSEIFGVSIDQLLGVSQVTSIETPTSTDTAYANETTNEENSNAVTSIEVAATTDTAYANETAGDSSTIVITSDNATQITPQKPEPVKIIAGWCSVCEKGVSPGEYFTEETYDSYGVTKNVIYCKECKDIIDHNNAFYKYSEEVSIRKRGLIWGMIAAIIALVISVIVIVNNAMWNYIPYFLIGVYAIFALVCQLIWDNSVNDVFLFFCRSFQMPGVIFSFSLDGLMFLIVVKIALAILSGLLSIGLFLIGCVITTAYAAIAFPIALIIKNKEIKDLEPSDLV